MHTHSPDRKLTKQEWEDMWLASMIAEEDARRRHNTFFAELLEKKGYGRL